MSADPHDVPFGNVAEHAASLLTHFDTTKARHDEAKAALHAEVQRAVRLLVPAGTMIAAHHAHAIGFGTVRLAGGNSRGAQRFMTCGEPFVLIDRSHLRLTTFRVEAHPINADGKAMSGRPGNGARSGDAVTLTVDAFPDHGPDDIRPDTQLLTELLTRTPGSANELEA